MKVITAHELASLTESELSALFRRVTAMLTRSERESAERRIALATLENIAHARCQLALQ